MLIAFHRVKRAWRGMVIAEKNEVLHEIALPLLGIMSNLKMSELIQEEKQMVKLLQERGYAHDASSIYNFILFCDALAFYTGNAYRAI